ncbi:hypothetical protein [Eikenella sp. NML120348]|uniref:hypothetical protein n=1 Tax=Eikenella sp. NML120348 TaxID=1795831 RepID=UPI0007E26EF3|nr:hypothetical protein [Eikenella sp. NML120348]OAM38337.1 hypothetical protein A7P99_04020 [Eikenella sp. NML120348]
MKTRCPCCGAENSLDALIAHEQARQSLWTLANIGGPMTLGLVKYLGLFRPNKSALSQARMASLMAELLPDIQAGQIYRNGQSYPAPVAAWAYAFNEVLAARDSGRLKTPLKSHGYLYEIIAGWAGNAAPMSVSIGDGAATPAISGGSLKQTSKTLDAVAQLEEMKHG